MPPAPFSYWKWIQCRGGNAFQKNKEIDLKNREDVIILVKVVENVVFFTNLDFYYNGFHSKLRVFC